MELLSHGQLMVIAPSEGYSRENDNAITTVDNAETLFYNALENVGLHRKNNKASANSGQIKAPQATQTLHSRSLKAATDQRQRSPDATGYSRRIQKTWLLRPRSH